jgi:hypothetical protein
VVAGASVDASAWVVASLAIVETVVVSIFDSDVDSDNDSDVISVVASTSV